MTSTIRLQWLGWIAVFFIAFFSIFPESGFYRAISSSIINVTFYATIIYGNIMFLLPLYDKGRKLQYISLAVILLVTAGLLRGYCLAYLYNKYFTSTPEPITPGAMLNFIIAGILTCLLSFVFRAALAYFELKQQSDKILAQKSQAELNLLKMQIQPHFLFNTLNNIYYEAYREAPATAKLIGRLANIMRYFVDESPKEEASLQTEVQFLENYIALEKIRIRHDTEINFYKDYQANTHIPPMLLTTFVENAFKHGIDKSSRINEIDMSLIEQDGCLIFRCSNRLVEPDTTQTAPHGFGLENLRKRLMLLYGDAFELNLEQTAQFFTAFLKVPLS